MYRTDKLEYDPLTHGIYDKSTHAVYDKREYLIVHKENYKNFIDIHILLLKDFSHRMSTEWVEKLVTKIANMKEHYAKHK